MSRSINPCRYIRQLQLQGIMPRKRMFELQPYEGPLIEGWLGPEIRDAHVLLSPNPPNEWVQEAI